MTQHLDLKDINKTLNIKTLCGKTVYGADSFSIGPYATKLVGHAAHLTQVLEHPETCEACILLYLEKQLNE